MTLILAFDTSGPHCAAGVFRDGLSLCTAIEPLAKGQAERLMGLLNECLSTAGAEWADLDALAVGVGPGNFTGIRISVAAARGAALAASIPAIGVSTLEAFAHRLAGNHHDAVRIAIPAPRDQVYAQRFRSGTAIDPPEMVAKDSDPCMIHCDPAQFPIADLASVALLRFGQETDRPAPLYVRAPDAALSTQAVPRIIP